MKSENRHSIVIIVVAAILGLFHLFTGYFGEFAPLTQRSFHLALVMFIGFLSCRRGARASIMDWFLAVLSLVITFYLIIAYPMLEERMGAPIFADLVVSALLLILIFELSRRSMGPTLPIISAIFLIYSIFGGYLSGFFQHRGVGLERLLYYMYMTTEGVYGLPLGVMASFVYLFMLFGSFLVKSGAGEFVTDLATAIAGSRPGGPAKVAVLSSGIMGMFSGSAVANVVTTGTFTIPMMKKIGYPAYYAAAIEAVASTGGVLMPPIMGSVAFIMADMMGVPYREVVLAASIPAALYYFAVYIQIHLAAKRMGLHGQPKKDLPKITAVLRTGWPFLFPPAVLIFILLYLQMSPALAAVYAIIATFFVAMARSKTRLSFQQTWNIFADCARSCVNVSLACALAGVIIGVCLITGLAVKMSAGLTDLAGGSIPLILILSMVSSLILGMGVTASVAYIIPAMMVAPVLIKAGIPNMAANMFILYFSVLSYVTPPVALSAYAAAGIAESDAGKTGWQAFRLALAGFIVPFVSVYSPALLLIGGLLNILWAITTAMLGAFALGLGIEGYLNRHLPVWERILVGVSGILLIHPGLTTDLVGFFGLGVFGILGIIYRKHAPREDLKLGITLGEEKVKPVIFCDETEK
jgi:TRAP transporter 4TM/12TM fusion protein